jgi:UTP--glucose-1-phosphate uridylyltransferase
MEITSKHMHVRKAVITAAGPRQRALPLQSLVDRDGAEKTALQIVLEEAISAGVEDVCLVIMPGDTESYRAAAGPHESHLHFVEQPEPRGYGDALSAAASFTGKDPFLHLVSDHLYVSGKPIRCAQQVVNIAKAANCSVSAVQATRESMLSYYGTVGARRVARHPDLYEIENVLEKPTPSEAEQKLLIPGLRAGYYLCFFGIHVLTPSVMEMLTDSVARSDPGKPVEVSSVLAQLAGQERYLALEVCGRRYNIGVKYGLLFAQLALAFDGAERESVLTQLVEQLALRRQAEQ